MIAPTPIALLSLLLFSVIAAAAVLFHYLQNKKAKSGEWVGGEISWPKAFWLAYAIGAWFFIPLLLALNEKIPELFRQLILIHTLIWWIRGILELIMIYRWMNWSPVYGISHDIAHGLLLTIGLAIVSAKIGWAAISIDLPTQIAFGFVVITVFALMAEMVFAALFIMTRGLSATKIYFASDSPEYCLINRLTTVVCVAVYAQLIAQTILLFRIR